MMVAVQVVKKIVMLFADSKRCLLFIAFVKVEASKFEYIVVGFTPIINSN
jgi:hypothetical protein